MNIPELLDLLEAAGVCDGRIYSLKVKKDDTRPYMTFKGMHGVQDEDLDGFAGTRDRLMLTGWCTSYAEAHQLILDVRAALDGAVSEAGVPSIDLDPFDDTLVLVSNLDFYSVNA
jgi:hypothetical protein